MWNGLATDMHAKNRKTTNMPMSTVLSRLALVAAFTAGILTQPAVASECQDGEQVMKFSLVTRLAGHPKGEAAMALAKAVNTQMDGTLCMELYPSSELYNDEDVFGALLDNSVQMAAPSASKFGPFSQELQLFDVPFVFDSALHVMEFLQTQAAADMLATVEDDGFAVLGFWTNGMYQMSATKPLRRPIDAKGLTFRVQSLSPSVQGLLDAMQAKGIKMSFSKVFDALRDGDVQAQYNTWSNIQSMGFYLHQAAVMETNHGYLGYPVVTSRAFLDSLAPDTREKLLNIFALVTHEQNRFAYEINQARRQDILDDDGVIVRLRDRELEVWRSTLAPLVDNFRQNVNAQLIDAAIIANAEADPF